MSAPAAAGEHVAERVPDERVSREAADHRLDAVVGSDVVLLPGLPVVRLAVERDGDRGRPVRVDDGVEAGAAGHPICTVGRRGVEDVVPRAAGLRVCPGFSLEVVATRGRR